MPALSAPSATVSSTSPAPCSKTARCSTPASRAKNALDKRWEVQSGCREEPGHHGAPWRKAEKAEVTLGVGVRHRSSCRCVCYSPLSVRAVFVHRVQLSAVLWRQQVSQLHYDPKDSI